MPISEYITTGPLDKILQDRDPGTQAILDLSVEENSNHYFLIAQLQFSQFLIKKYYAFLPKLSRKEICCTKANLALEGDLEALAEKFPDLEIKEKEKRFGRECVHT